MHKNFVRDLKQVRAGDVSLAGGKGVSLGEMTAAGFPVPPGFVVLTDAFELFLNQNNIAKTAELDPGKDCKDMCVPEVVEIAVREAFERLGAERVAVRSSATAEDGANAAWAGQLDSYLDTTAENLLENLKKCWLSLLAPRAIAYSSKHDAGENISMGVVIQQMVPAQAAGVAFTAHPVTGDTARIIVEADSGLGEDLVSGRVTPDNYVIEKTNLQISKKTAAGDAQLLSDSEIKHLAHLIARIEAHFGFPVDVEWAKAGRDFFIVQSRPITALAYATFNESAETVYSNMNIAEVLPGVIPPLSTDMILHIIGPAIIKLLNLPENTELARTIKGRLYFNVTNLKAALVQLSGSEDIDITALLGGGQSMPLALGRVPLLKKVKLAGFGAKAFFIALSAHRKYSRFAEEVDRTTAELLHLLESTNDPMPLLALKDKALEQTEKLAARSLMMNAFPFSFYVIFSAVAKRWLNSNGDNRAHALLSTGGYGLQEIEALTDLWSVRSLIKLRRELEIRFQASQNVAEALAVLESDSEVWAAYQRFIEDHGHRCANELNFSVPRWREEPSFIVNILKSYLLAADSNDPKNKRQKLASDQVKLLAAAQDELPGWKIYLLNKLLALAVDGQRKRENTKSEVIKLLVPLRAILLKIGRQLAASGLVDLPEDIFMLSLEELNGLARKRAWSRDYFAAMRARKNEYKGYEAIDLPPIIRDADNPFRGDSRGSSKPESAGKNSSLAGIAVSRGRVEGIARVVASLNDIAALVPGDILVTDHTDPGWTPVFPIVKGLITNTGGLISHAAIVAREYGLPAVVNVADATKTIADGQKILLDAEAGIVHLL